MKAKFPNKPLNHFRIQKSVKMYLCTDVINLVFLFNMDVWKFVIQTFVKSFFYVIKIL